MGKLGGAPSLYTEELAAEICANVARGMSVQAASREVGINPSTSFDWLLKHDWFANEYARARKARADARFERIDQVLQDLREKTIDAAMARVEVDTIKWQCGKENAPKYGERLELAGSVDVSKGWAETLRERRAKRAERDKP